MDFSCAKLFLIRSRASANSFLSQYEPLTLLIAPLLTLLVARILQSIFSAVHDKGLKQTVIGFFMSWIKLVPGVNSYIEAQKQKVRCITLAFDLIFIRFFFKLLS
ncbi:Sphingosine-1-phosphate lyase-like protein [Melia azedarach]|uniref:Sphingosine-1-phosphate lyase-like protein n=1 Tax=Melia azedarach TaxID=155640 RepID=A0ACC1XVI1_MELAZ|nr:Sphingosine-1-phosphate lyase-like protein [Melia azedarach]